MSKKRLSRAISYVAAAVALLGVAPMVAMFSALYLGPFGPITEGRHQEKVVEDEGLNRALNDISARVAPHVAGVPWSTRVVIIETDAPNADTARRTVFFNTATLKLLTSDAERAAIMAHELAHVHLMHSFSSELLYLLSDIAPEGALKQWSRGQLERHLQSQEFEADAACLPALKAAGYSPEACVSAFEKLLKAGDVWNANMRERYGEENEDKLHTHPAPQARVAQLKKLLAELPAD